MGTFGWVLATSKVAVHTSGAVAPPPGIVLYPTLPKNRPLSGQDYVPGPSRTRSEFPNDTLPWTRVILQEICENLQTTTS
jgi:hypothetical protein